MLDVEPRGLFVAVLDDAPVGLTTTASYDATGWIGNVVVAADHRGEGLGTALVQAAVDHLRDAGAETVGLYALADSRSLYERLGFEARGEVVAATGDLDGTATWDADEAGDPGRPDDAGDGGAYLQRIVDLDRTHVAADRSRYLEAIAARRGVRVAVTDRAYLYARPGKVWELGPAVAASPDAFGEVLDRVVSSLQGPAEAAVPAANRDALGMFEDAGLSESYRATTMTLSGDGDLYDPQAVYGVLGLEKG